MANMTLSIDEKTYLKMKQFSEIKWSEVARKAIKERLEMLQLAEKLANKSKLTKQDVKDFSNKIKKSSAKRFMG